MGPTGAPAACAHCPVSRLADGCADFGETPGLCYGLRLTCASVAAEAWKDGGVCKKGSLP